MKQRRYIVVLGQPKLDGPWEKLKLDMSLVGEIRHPWLVTSYSKAEADKWALRSEQMSGLWNYEVKELK